MIRPGPESQTSKQHKWERRRGAGGESRRGRRRLGRWHNSQHPVDFEARGTRHAIWKPPMAEPRALVNASPCGRRTSLGRQWQSPPHSLSIRAGSERFQIRVGRKDRARYGQTLFALRKGLESGAIHERHRIDPMPPVSVLLFSCSTRRKVRTGAGPRRHRPAEDGDSDPRPRRALVHGRHRHARRVQRP